MTNEGIEVAKTQRSDRRLVSFVIPSEARNPLSHAAPPRPPPESYPSDFAARTHSATSDAMTTKIVVQMMYNVCCSIC